MVGRLESRAAERLSPGNLEWLAGLPYTRREGHVEFSHGSPVQPGKGTRLATYPLPSGSSQYPFSTAW